MSRLKDHIRTTPEYRQVAGQQQSRDRSARDRSGRTRGASVPTGDPAAGADPLKHITDAEKGDIQFWCIVLQTVLLALIYYELRNGGA